MQIGGWLLKPALKEHLVKRMDYSEYGGALLLGIRGGLIICHGSSKSWAIRNAIKLAKDVAKTDLHEIIAEALKKIEKNDEFVSSIVPIGDGLLLVRRANG